MKENNLIKNMTKILEKKEDEVLVKSTSDLIEDFCKAKYTKRTPKAGGGYNYFYDKPKDKKPEKKESDSSPTKGYEFFNELSDTISRKTAISKRAVDKWLKDNYSKKEAMEMISDYGSKGKYTDIARAILSGKKLEGKKKKDSPKKEAETVEHWTKMLKEAPESFISDTATYYRNKKTNWNSGKIKITPSEKNEIIAFQTAMNKLGLDKKYKMSPQQTMKKSTNNLIKSFESLIK